MAEYRSMNMFDIFLDELDAEKDKLPFICPSCCFKEKKSLEDRKKISSTLKKGVNVCTVCELDFFY